VVAVRDRVGRGGEPMEVLGREPPGDGAEQENGEERSVHAGTYAGTPGTATNLHFVLQTNEHNENRTCNARRTSPELRVPPGGRGKRAVARRAGVHGRHRDSAGDARDRRAARLLLVFRASRPSPPTVLSRPARET